MYTQQVPGKGQLWHDAVGAQSLEAAKEGFLAPQGCCPAQPATPTKLGITGHYSSVIAILARGRVQVYQTRKLRPLGKPLVTTYLPELEEEMGLSLAQEEKATESSALGQEVMAADVALDASAWGWHNGEGTCLQESKCMSRGQKGLS